MRNIQSFSDVQEGMQLPVLETEIDRLQLIKFAGAVDDYAAPHWSLNAGWSSKFGPTRKTALDWPSVKSCSHSSDAQPGETADLAPRKGGDQDSADHQLPKCFDTVMPTVRGGAAEYCVAGAVSKPKE